MDYRVGSVLVYSPFGGGERRVQVDTKEEDIKNGRPGFAGVMVPSGGSVWGYDDQILRVESF